MSAAAALELVLDEVETFVVPSILVDTRATRGDTRDQAITEGSVGQLGGNLIFIPVHQHLSSRHSWDVFIGELFKHALPVKAVYREKYEDGLRFYVIASDDETADLDPLFNIEQYIYRIFPKEELDFEVLLGEEMKSALPSGAVELWHR
jgi:hypothetical protein